MTDMLNHNEQSILFECDAALWDLDEQPVEDNGHDYWLHKRQTDIKYCGWIKIRERPENGQVSFTFVSCNEPDCPNCGPKIRAEMTKHLSAILTERPLRKITLTGTVEEQKQQRAKIVRKYGKNLTSAFPSDILTETGLKLETEMLIDTQDEIGEAYTALSDDDIVRWSQKSFQAKKSGALHKLKSLSSPAGEVNELDVTNICHYEEWQTDTSDMKLLKEIEKEVLRETSYLKPMSVWEVERALEIRRKVRKARYELKGIVILSNKPLKRIINVDKIDWSFGKLKE